MSTVEGKWVDVARVQPMKFYDEGGTPESGALIGLTPHKIQIAGVEGDPSLRDGGMSECYFCLEPDQIRKLHKQLGQIIDTGTNGQREAFVDGDPDPNPPAEPAGEFDYEADMLLRRQSK